MDDTTTFGYSLELDNGDLVIENDQLLTVAGKPNLLQALTLRVLTPYGSDQFNTTYGLDVSQAFTQPNGLSMVKELIKLNLVRTLGTDPRVDDISQVLFDDDPAYLAAHPEIAAQTLIDQHHRRYWQVDVTITTAQSQPVTLPVSVGV
ncbi:MAG: hypothetical protein KDE53_20375 [Caldilineaceae bacterium]|nr:hypothetical protein [Caldilineaceae bacterium]MCB0126376.1 hypothetical protein [Caldilineaceae bacterium]MCB0138214.1 hypothetical protein [Caldilineaceae bacterium]